MKSSDDLGLPYFHTMYARRSHTACLGRGLVTHITKYGSPQEERKSFPCDCTISGYRNTRLAVEAKIREAINRGETQEQVLPGILKELGL